MATERIFGNLIVWLAISLAVHALAWRLLPGWGAPAPAATVGDPLFVSLPGAGGGSQSSPSPTPTASPSLPIPPHPPRARPSAPEQPAAPPPEPTPAMAAHELPLPVALVPAPGVAAVSAATAGGATEAAPGDGGAPAAGAVDMTTESGFGRGGDGRYSPPVFVRRVEPVYPRLARDRGWEGTVELDVTVGTDGRPGRIDVAKSSGYDLLDRSALTAARHWRFVPAGSVAAPRQETVRVPVAFVLRRNGDAARPGRAAPPQPPDADR